MVSSNTCLPFEFDYEPLIDLRLTPCLLELSLLLTLLCVDPTDAILDLIYPADLLPLLLADLFNVKLKLESWWLLLVCAKFCKPSAKVMSLLLPCEALESFKLALIDVLLGADKC